MSRQIKLIWDFFGEDAEATAKHHAIHLEEFAKKEKLFTFGTGTEMLRDNQCMAYLIVEETNMILVRDALKPQRGQWVET